MADFARSEHSGVQRQLDRLAKVSMIGDRLGLERIAQLLDRLGRPQDVLPPAFHVAGTNGKGSTCAFLRAALEAAGHKVHVFTSPHLVRFNERIRLAGRLIDDEPLAALLEEVIDADTGIESSFFEVTTAAALLAFARTPADAAVIEVGLGGRLDATNIIEQPVACGIAALGIDHRDFLGDRLAGIATEKAGIAKHGVPLLTQLYRPSISERVGEVAQAAGARWLPRGGQWDAIVGRDTLRYRDSAGPLDLPLPRLPGRHQAMNAALHQSALSIPESALSAAMGWTDWPARMQRLGPGPLTTLAAGSEIWLDGGHNASASRAIALFARRHFADGMPMVLLFASLTSKDPEAVLRPLRGIAAEVRTLPIEGHASFTPAELATLGARLGFNTSEHASLEAALSGVPAGSRVLIFGSLYLAGQALAANGQAPD